MPEGYSVDLGPVLRAISSTESRIQSSVSNVRSELSARITGVDNRLLELKAQVDQMIEENRRTAALQRAITEIIRVRQELDLKYGKYQDVRDTMMGILGASDLNLIRESTIASIGEELMLQTPKYWLAPVVIALGAWISNNKTLAERALEEALKRNEEKTCLVFALICRRNGRTDACYQWLSRYFRLQKSSAMKESIIAYIDAYANGVFGPDKDNIGEEYINRWMAELKENNPNFERDQIDYWKQAYEIYCVDFKQDCKELAACAPDDFPKMNALVSRLKAMPIIVDMFANIMQTPVDKQVLVEAIDNELVKLVTNYDDEEAPLREEEAFFADVKASKGDERYAEARKRLRRLKRMDNSVDLAQRLSDAITSNDQSNISAKKTAIRFLKEYIQQALGEFIMEKAPEYPAEITLKLQGWSGKTADGSNRKALKDSFVAKRENDRKDDLATIKNTGWMTMLIIGCVGLLLGILFIALGAAKVFDMGIGVGIPFLLLGIGMMIGFIAKFKGTKKKRANMNAEYDAKIAAGKKVIDAAIDQRIACNEIYTTFNPEIYSEKLALLEE